MTKQEYDKTADEIMRLIQPTPPLWYISLVIYSIFLSPLIILWLVVLRLIWR